MRRPWKALGKGKRRFMRRPWKAGEKAKEADLEPRDVLMPLLNVGQCRARRGVARPLQDLLSKELGLLVARTAVKRREGGLEAKA